MRYLNLLLLIPVLAFADGPVYTLGNGEAHAFSCDPPTARVNGMALDQTELDYTTLFFMKDDPDSAPQYQEQSDINCGLVFDVDQLTEGQWYMRATITDTGGRESTLSATNAPFVLTLPPPNAPTVLQ